jgi:acetyltransferase-like isoleucine patch superfamily enzyme
MIGGRTHIGNNSTLNFKAAAINALTLCDNIEIGACSSVTKNIDKPGLYVGTPARRIGDVREKDVH